MDGPHTVDTPAKLGRLSLLSEIAPAVSSQFSPDAGLAILLVDASSLERIEPIYGHSAYLRALDAVAEFIRQIVEESFPGTAVMARGDVGRSELYVILLRTEDPAALCLTELPRLARSLRRGLDRRGQRLAYPYLRELRYLPLGSSVLLRNPRLGALTQLREGLDAARQDADLNGRIYRRDCRRRFTSLLLERRIRSVYEPIVCAKTLTVYGYEALARGPADSEYAEAAALFKAASEHDMLYELDCLCREAALEGAIGFPSGTKLFMNIRPTAIHDPRFQTEALIRTLERSGLAPGDVVFEISEQESIANYEIFREARDDYGRLGFQFALDDTGAGYASMEAVMELAPEFVKVDRAFVHQIDEDEGRQAMVRGFQQVARSVGARIVGEGLDRLEELQKLAELGIEFGQGWLFGKPTPLRAQER